MGDRARPKPAPRSLTQSLPHGLLLVAWIALGLGLRVWNLESKPLWTDEFATLVFSLGHRFQTLPLNQVLSLDALLEPLRVDPHTTLQEVTQNLLQDSNHPPLFFGLMHRWLSWFSTQGEWVSVFVARSLAVLFGELTILLAFGVGWLGFRSLPVAHLTAAMVAVSPFGVYLAQEARHYTLPMLWIWVSLACWLQVGRSLQRGTPIPLGVIGLWIGINGLGIATHYFFAFTLLAMAIASLVWLVKQRQNLEVWRSLYRNQWRLLTIVMGTLVLGLVWLPWLQGTPETELTQWIYVSDRQGWDWLTPLGQTLAGLVTLLYMLPIQAPSATVAIASGVGMVIAFLVTLFHLRLGWHTVTMNGETRLGLDLLGGFVLTAIALFWGITYLGGMDLTSAFRYQFVYCPAVLLLVGVGLAGLWQVETGKRGIVLGILILSAIGSVVVVNNGGYQKTHRPDIVTQAIWTEAQTSPQIPTLVAIAHRTHGQTGRLMAIAWEWQRLIHDAPEEQHPKTPKFLLAHQTENPRSVVHVLDRTLTQTSRDAPQLTLWLINLQQVPDRPLDRVLAAHHCTAILDVASVDGYQYQPFRCGTR